MNYCMNHVATVIVTKLKPEKLKVIFRRVLVYRLILRKYKQVTTEHKMIMTVRKLCVLF